MVTIERPMCQPLCQRKRRNGCCRWMIYGILLAIGVMPGCSNTQQQEVQHSDESTNSQDRSVRGVDDDRLSRAVEYLLRQQAADGGWHSDTYGALEGGSAITSLVLYAMSGCPDSLWEPHRAQLQRAVAFQMQGIRKKGYVCNPDGAPEYTNYASAMLLIANHRMQLGLPAGERDRLIEYLCQAQLGPNHGIDPEDPDFGGWDLSGWMLGPRKSMGTNVSVSSIVLRALDLFRDDHVAVETAMERAATWVPRCQNFVGDGGFFFHPLRMHDGNKAGWPDIDHLLPRSYGTATCDGIDCLNHLPECGSGMERIASAVAWLQRNDSVDRVPGFSQTGDSTGWDVGLLFYYWSAMATIHQSLPEKFRDETGRRIRVILNELQKEDGSFVNDSNRMREDDPLIATSFSVITFALLPYETDAAPEHRNRIPNRPLPTAPLGDETGHP